jgi:hypothetical protein
MQLPSSPPSSPPLMPSVLDTQPPFTQEVLQVPSDESSEPKDNEGTEPEQPEVPEELVSDRDEEVDKQDGEQPSVESLVYDLQVLFKGSAPRTSNMPSVNRSKYPLGVEGVGHHLALEQCIEWWLQEPQSKQWRVVRKEVIIVHALGKKVVTAYCNDVADNPFEDWEDTLEVAVRLHRDDRLGIKLIVPCELEYEAPAVVVGEASAVAAAPVVPAAATTPT